MHEVQAYLAELVYFSVSIRDVSLNLLRLELTERSRHPASIFVVEAGSQSPQAAVGFQLGYHAVHLTILGTSHAEQLFLSIDLFCIRSCLLGMQLS